MIRKKNLFVVGAVVLLTAVAVEGAGIWLAGVDAPLTYDEEAAYVETLEASEVTEDSVTLNGELVHLRGYDDVDLYFEYREEGTDNGWTTVNSDDDVSSSQEFSEEVTDLTDETAYEYRAVVEDTDVLDRGLIVGFITLTLEEGDGTETDPYIVSDWYDLFAVRNDMEAYYELDQDINDQTTGYDDLVDTEEGWLPIGTENVRFEGVFDGQGHTIEDLYIDRPDQNNVGLFGHVGHNTGETIIRDVCMDDATVTGARGVGTLIGRVTGNDQTLIENACAVDGEGTGTGAVGGLIGSFNSWRITAGGRDNPILRESFADMDVKDQDDVETPDKFGGLVGCGQKSNVEDSYSLGNVSVENSGERIGGLLGCIDLRGEIIDSYSTGKVETEASESVGALVGNIEGVGGNAGSVETSYSNKETSGQDELVGEIGDGDVTGGMRTTDEMTDYHNDYPDSYEDWDFDEIWQYGGVTDREGNSGYPALRWQD